MADIPPFTEWLCQKLGTDRWVVACRLTPRLEAKGYTIAVSQKRFSALKLEFAS